MLMTKEKYWIKRLTFAYIAVAAAGIVQLAFAAAKIFLPLLRWMNVDFVNYGSDTVSGWETIFSLLEVLSGTFFAPILFAAIALFTVITAAYWIVGIIASPSLKKASQSGLSYNGSGIFFGIWAIIPIVIRIGSSLFQSTGINPDTADISQPLIIIHSWYLFGTDFCRARILTSARSIQTVHISFSGCGLPSCQWGIPLAFRPPLPLEVCSHLILRMRSLDSSHRL